MTGKRMSFKRKTAYAVIIGIIVFGAAQCRQAPPAADKEFLASANCQKALAAMSEKQFEGSLHNLSCASAFVDQDAPITLTFPASTKASNFPADVTITTNEDSTTVYYTNNDTSPTTSSAQYSVPFNTANSNAISADTNLRYFGVDSSGNTEIVRIDQYIQDTSLPEITLTNLSSHYLNDTSSITVDVGTNFSARYKVEVNGNGTIGNGTTLVDSTFIPGNTVSTITINGSDLDAGLNEIFVYMTLDGNTAYSSFSLYKDDKPPFVQASPDDTTVFNYQPEVSLFTIEKATIYYTNNGTTPTTGSTVYTNPILLPAGITQLRFFAVDNSGNASEVATKTYNVDLVAPTITIVDVTCPNTDGANEYLNSTGSCTIEWTSDENLTAFSFEDGGSSMGQGTALDSGSLDLVIDPDPESVISGATLAEGSQALRLYGRDEAGNIGIAIQVIVVDNTAFTPRVFLPLTDWAIKSGDVFFSWSDVESQDSATGSGVFNYDLEYATDFAFSSPTVVSTFNTDRTETIATGTYYWRVKSRDNLGNESPYSAVRTIYVGKAASDVDGDNLEDIVVGDPGYGGNGAAHLFTGNAGCPGTCNNTPKLTITGQDGGGQFGHSVAIIRDITGGGRADILIGAPNATVGSLPNAGKAYLFHGENIDAKCSFPAACTLTSADADVVFTGQSGGNNLGFEVSSAGDLNQDSFGDFAIAAPSATGNAVNSGVVYVYFGGSTVSTSPGLTIPGSKISGQFGQAICHAGDMNGDGAADLFIGEPVGDSLAGANTGVGYLFQGGTGVDNAYDNLFYGSELSNSSFASSCARGLDVDGDGFEEIILGAKTDASFGTNYGKAYLFYGAASQLTVPGYQFQAGGAQGLAGSSVLGLYQNGDDNADVFMAVPGTVASSGQSLYLYDGITLNNPTTTGTPTNDLNTTKYDFGLVVETDAMAVWGDLDSSEIDVFAVGDSNAQVLYIYQVASGSRETISAPGGSVQFGYSIGGRP